MNLGSPDRIRTGSAGAAKVHGDGDKAPTDIQGPVQTGSRQTGSRQTGSRQTGYRQSRSRQTAQTDRFQTNRTEKRRSWYRGLKAS